MGTMTGPPSTEGAWLVVVGDAVPLGGAEGPPSVVGSTAVGLWEALGGLGSSSLVLETS